MGAKKEIDVIYVEKSTYEGANGKKEVIPNHVKLVWMSGDGRRWTKFIECSETDLEEISKLPNKKE